MADTKAQNERDAAWWAAWREADFTWEGLAKGKPWEGWVVTAEGYAHRMDDGRRYGAPKAEGETPAPVKVEGRPASLQDYWRADPGTGRLRSDDEMGDELARAEGQPTYHRAHLPLAYENGAPTGKAHWPNDALDALINPRLLPAEETKWAGALYHRRLAGADSRAQLHGGVWLCGAAHPQGRANSLSVRYEDAAFVKDARFDSAIFSGGASFQNVFFSGDASFGRATFHGDLGFQGASFSGGAVFESATFFGSTEFDGATFKGSANFESSTFSSPASFENVTFSDVVLFESSTFSGDVRFNSATFSHSARFESATFSGYAGFSHVTFSDAAWFESATFTDAQFARTFFVGDAYFESATFSGYAIFEQATFDGVAKFESATFARVARFQSAVFSEEAGFKGATFSGEAQFEGATFSGNAWFLDCKFVGPARLQAKVFEKAAWFHRSLFSELVSFDGVAFRGDMDFTAAVFEKLASFEKITWPEHAQLWHSAFDQALFRSTIAVTGSGFRAFAAFDGATLERGVQIDEVDERKADATFKRERKKAIDAAYGDGVTFEENENKARKQKGKLAVTRREIAAHVREARETRLKQLERGCRVLKLAMEQASNKSREQLLYRFELQARRSQRRLPFGEKTFSYLYAFASDYGASMWRPFAALAVLIAIFAGSFFVWSYALGQIGEGDGQIDFVTAAWQALDLSWANVFKPLSALTSEAKETGTLAAALLSDRPSIAFAVRAVATLESLLAIVLAFLFALAVRRRFQIT